MKQLPFDYKAHFYHEINEITMVETRLESWNILNHFTSLECFQTKILAGRERETKKRE